MFHVIEHSEMRSVSADFRRLTGDLIDAGRGDAVQEPDGQEKTIDGAGCQRDEVKRVGSRARAETSVSGREEWCGTSRLNAATAVGMMRAI